MAPKTKEQKELERRALLTPEEREAEDKNPKAEVPTAKIEDPIIPGEVKKIPPKEDTVEIKRSDFEKMMKTMEKQSKDIELLYKTADKGRIAKELNKEGENLIKQSSVSTWGDTGRLIIAWSDLITNKCEVVMGRWVEDQTLNVIFEDGEVLTVPYLEFARNRTVKLPADVIGRTEEDGRLKYKLQFPSGKILTVDTRFLN